MWGPVVRHNRRWLGAAALLAVVLSFGPAWTAVGEASFSAIEPRRAVRYVAPVHGPVIDPFRPPAHIGAPGNRGLQYGNPLWVPVVAAAEGEVVFAGQVFGNGTVVIAHPDGVDTTYNGMSEVWVSPGTPVRQLDGLGLAGTTVHFGARRGSTYLDPQILIDASVGDGRVRLVPVDEPP